MGSTKGRMFLAMAIFGTTGFFMRYIPLPAATVAVLCGLLGVVTILVLMKATRRRFHWRHIKKYAPKMILTGAALGGSWLLLMESHNYTPDGLSMAVYYIGPLAVMLLAPVVDEKVENSKLLSGILSFLGIVLMANVLGNGLKFNLGVLFSLGAAVLYCVVIFNNKTLQAVSSYSKTAIELGAATVVMLIYSLLTKNFAVSRLGGSGIVAVAILGIVHVGIAYRMYFNGIIRTKIQNTALYSYLNPAVSIFIAAFILKQKLTVGEVGGAVLILIGVMVNELLNEKIGRLFDKKG